MIMKNRLLCFRSIPLHNPFPPVLRLRRKDQFSSPLVIVILLGRTAAAHGRLTCPQRLRQTSSKTAASGAVRGCSAAAVVAAAAARWSCEAHGAVSCWGGGRERFAAAGCWSFGRRGWRGGFCSGCWDGRCRAGLSGGAVGDG